MLRLRPGVRFLALPSCLLLAVAAWSAEAAPSAAAANAESAPAPAPAASAPPRLLSPSASSLAPDVRSGHFFLKIGAAYGLPWSKAEAGLSQTDLAGFAPSFHASLALGVSRYVLLVASGQYVALGDGPQCASCSAKSYAVGLAAQYHLVDGTPFDPWLSFGIGYRVLDGVSAVGLTGPTRYQGVDWARLRLGSDSWISRGFALGPFAELDLGTYGSRTPGPMGDPAMHAFFAVGLAATVDFVGR